MMPSMVRKMGILNVSLPLMRLPMMTMIGRATNVVTTTLVMNLMPLPSLASPFFVAGKGLIDCISATSATVNRQHPDKRSPQCKEPEDIPQSEDKGI